MNEIYAYWISFAKITVLVIFSCKIWQLAVFFFWGSQMAVLQGWQMAMLLDWQMARLLDWQMPIFPFWQMAIIPNMTDANLITLFVHRCTRVIMQNRLRWRDAQNLHATFSLGLAAKEPSSRFAYGCSVWNVCDECFIQRKTLMFFLLW